MQTTRTVETSKVQQILEGSNFYDLLNSIAKEVEIKGYTLNEFLTKHGSEQIDFKDVEAAFSTHMQDYGTRTFNDTDKYKCLQFCSMMLFTVGPESRQVKAPANKAWGFKVKNENPTVPRTDGVESHPVDEYGIAVGYHIIDVSTYKDKDLQYKYENTEFGMKLSIKLATLLAVNIFNRVIMSTDTIMLTPLAGACYARSVLPEMASLMGVTPIGLCVMLNMSAQSGAHVCDTSDPTLAVLTSLCATRNLKDQQLRYAIVQKTTKQYCAVNKKPKRELMQLLSKFATGGVASDLMAQALCQMYDGIMQMEASKVTMSQQRAINNAQPLISPAQNVAGGSNAQ